MIGITGYSVYVPRHRIRRETVAAAWGAAAAPGRKAVAGFDEDSLTMAQAAAWPLAEAGPVEAISFASTSAPYWQRSAASLIAAACDLPAMVATADFAASLRCGTTALRSVFDAVAAGAVGSLLGLAFPVWQQGLANLGQIHRRCQVKGEARGILVLDDYGHHPTEIRSTLTGLARAFPERRLVVAFQPHRYSRTRALLPEFFPVFDQAQMVFITEIYGAGEDRLNGVSGRSVYEGVLESGHPGVHFIEENAPMADYILDHLNVGDLVLTLGAGDIWKTGEELLARLQNPSADREARGS